MGAHPATAVAEAGDCALGHPSITSLPEQSLETEDEKMLAAEMAARAAAQAKIYATLKDPSLQGKWPPKNGQDEKEEWTILHTSSSKLLRDASTSPGSSRPPLK